MKAILKFALSTASLCLSLAATGAAAGNLGVFTSDAQGSNTHTFYYDDGQEVLLIDTQFVPGLTAAMLKEIQSKTKSPITRVIVTHPNPDKYNGLPYLHQLGIESISSAAVAQEMPKVHAYKENFWVEVAKAFPAGAYPSFENVKTTFKDRLVLKLKSGETVSLFELKNPGVATKQVVVRIDRSGDLIVGDLLHNKAHLWLEGGLVDGKPQANLASWSAAVGELPALAAGKPEAKAYGGRGEFIPVLAAVKEQQRYLTQADLLVRSYIAQLGERQAELKNPQLAAPHYKELERRFASAFPDYKLSYMVGYSVYGLVDSLIK